MKNQIDSRVATFKHKLDIMLNSNLASDFRIVLNHILITVNKCGNISTLVGFVEDTYNIDSPVYVELLSQYRDILEKEIRED